MVRMRFVRDIRGVQEYNLKEKNMRKTTLASVLAITSVALMSAAAPLSAVAADPSVGETEVYTSEMNLVSFDPEVAAANGYEVRTLDNGRQYSVPVGTPSDFVPAPEDTAPGPVEPGDVTTRATVWGDCGSSYVIVNSSEVRSGYNIRFDVMWGKWGVYVHSQGPFDQDFNLDHGGNGGQFDATRAVAAEHHGTGFARINTGSYAMTTNGGACYSGYVQDDTYFS